MVRINQKNLEREIPEFEEASLRFQQSETQMEIDSQYHDFSVPSEWDADFRKAIVEGVRRKRTIKQFKKQLKNVAIAACITLVILGGTDFACQKVTGDTMVEVFKNTYENGSYKIDVFGTSENLDMNYYDDPTVSYYTGGSLEEVYSQFREDIKRPTFQIKDCMHIIEIDSAYYTSIYNSFCFEFRVPDGKIYISQEEILDDSSLCIVYDNAYEVVWNEYLQQNIYINQSIQDNTYLFSVQKDRSVLHFRSSANLSTCCQIAQSIYYE